MQFLAPPHQHIGYLLCFRVLLPDHVKDIPQHRIVAGRILELAVINLTAIQDHSLIGRAEFRRAR